MSTVIKILDEDRKPAALFGGTETSFTVMPGGPTYKVVAPDAKPGKYTFETEKVPPHDRPEEPMPGTIEVSK